MRDGREGSGFTSMRVLASDSESDNENKGPKAWCGAQKAEAEVWQKKLEMSRPRELGEA